MQVNLNDRQHFGAMTVKGDLFKRCNSPRRYGLYQALDRCQSSNELADIAVTVADNGRLSAKVSSKNFSRLPVFKENPLKAMLNLSPIGFLEKVCRFAEKIQIEEKELAKFAEKIKES